MPLEIERRISVIKLRLLQNIQEFVNQTVRIRNMPKADALTTIKLANISSQSKDILLRELLAATTKPGRQQS